MSYIIIDLKTTLPASIVRIGNKFQSQMVFENNY